jgi:hypothetical protein
MGIKLNLFKISNLHLGLFLNLQKKAHEFYPR